MISHCIDQSLVERAQIVMALLRRAGLSVVTAESCTAGLISAVLSQADGAGHCLHGSFVTYTKAHKVAALGVSRELLAAKGSVHEDVARQMAEGALHRSTADIVLALTGVIGPEEDEDGNSVGRVIFACGRRQDVLNVVEENFDAAHHEILRRAVVLRGLDYIRKVASG